MPRGFRKEQFEQMPADQAAVTVEARSNVEAAGELLNKLCELSPEQKVQLRKMVLAFGLIGSATTISMFSYTFEISLAERCRIRFWKNGQ